MDDLLSEFISETVESLGEIDTALVDLERNPQDTATLGNIFRLMHTIKGTCGFLGLPRLESVAHAAENVLGKFRDGELEVTPDAVTVILSSIDRIKTIVDAIADTGAEPEGDDTDLIGALNAFAAQDGSAPADAPADDAGADALFDDPVDVAEVAAPAPAEPVPVAVLADPAPEAPANDITPPATETAAQAGGAVAAQNIRVSVDVLENLMTLVGELVLTRNQLLQLLRSAGESDFTVALQRLNHITTDLQEGVMKTRMQPIGNAWNKLPRIIRDLAIETGKKIDLDMRGAETELDRQVLEMIRDPLTHMVRNSADHGLELPADRRDAGKPETGKILLQAYHEGGHIIIKIVDDGRGLNTDRIREKAIANGLVDKAEAAGLSDQQIHQFVFRAGFSTAEKVTSVSGRGVGMDVVRTNIEKIGGSIELRSEEGRGTTFTIKIPLTLAIVSSLIVECGGERFAIPQLAVVELVRSSARSGTRLEMVNDTPVFRLRDRLLPLVFLSRLLELDGGRGEATADDLERIESEDHFIIVAQVGTQQFGIIVDKVFDTEEIVVKPVSPILRSITLFSGNTILGDGSVVMILDPNGIAEASGEVASRQDEGEAAARQVQDTTSLLVFRADGEELRAVPLALVSRIEQIGADKVELCAGQQVIQYRGELMPVVGLNGAAEFRPEGVQPVLVFADHDKAMGLVVDEIIDIVEQPLDQAMPSATRGGTLGSAIVNGRATEVLDVGHHLSRVVDGWYGADQRPFQPERGATRRLLLVDDSAFYRNMIEPVLRVEGYAVEIAENPKAALALLEDDNGFDVVVTDIEMPEMNGYQFAEALRSDHRLAGIPTIAVSSHATEEDRERGLKSGFVQYVPKFQREQLLVALEGTLNMKEAA